MDDDPVLRSLEADLERDDPALAAFLSVGSPTPRRHSRTWVLLALPLLVPALLLPERVTFGVVATLLILGSPLFVCWLCASREGLAGPPA
ncbi:DUF3040 domain-containing protein [Blastococcus sp. CT_GayMR16]|uniref:DUF3040 domain-containing protein n=1 Tax=Blastococcus sp. CT_GayMR16 TaxID=2559607 RepID=UPI0010741D48|nr:DUF3040 domain-containing protein [Blastococcus sp. CT_GayMR16]TFV87933.1 DUF3040 domain-containing protein [Blastococcus sp. CT_GayMR16]